MKKETKFWKRGIKALLAIGLLTSMLIPTTAMANEYETPSDGEVEDPNSIDIDINFNSYGEYTVMHHMQSYEKKNVKLGSTYKEAGVQFPEVSFKDLKFIGWVDYEGNLYDENSLIDYDDTYKNLYPKFDKFVTSIYFQYVDRGGDIKQHHEFCIVDNYEITYRELANLYKDFKLDDMSDEYKFIGWEDRNEDHLDYKLGFSGGSAGYKAKFQDKTVVQMYYEYYDTRGVKQISSKAKFVDENTTYEDLSKEISTLPLPETVKGLRTNGWEKMKETGVVHSYNSIYMKPNYENYIVRFMVDDSFRAAEKKSTRGAAAWFDETKIDTVYAVVVEPGETVSIPEIKEYTNINWVKFGITTLPEGDNLVINDHTTFVGYGDKVDVPIVNPDDGNNDNNDTNVPDVTLPEEEINNAVNEVKNAAKGEKVTVDMKDNVTLPVEVLESARGKDVEVVFNMGAYSWSINGLDITADTLKSINLEVKLNANAISTDVVKTLAGDRPTMQLSLSHNGEFGFKAKLQFNLGAEHKGKYGNLYYYNKDGKLEFMNAGKIDESGNVSLEFTHASDYVVVIDEKSMEPKNTKSPIQDTASTVGSNGIIGMLILVGLGGTCYLANKKVKAKAN